MTGRTFASRACSVCKWFVPFPHLFFSSILLAETFFLFCVPFFFAAAVLLSQLLLCRNPTCCFRTRPHLSLRPAAVVVASCVTATPTTASSIQHSCHPKRSAFQPTARRISLASFASLASCSTSHMLQGTAAAGTVLLPRTLAFPGRM